MEEAKRLLRERELPVSEIAYTLGYEHVSNFCKEFKKFTGKRAGEWRKGFVAKNGE